MKAILGISSVNDGGAGDVQGKGRAAVAIGGSGGGDNGTAFFRIWCSAAEEAGGRPQESAEEEEDWDPAIISKSSRNAELGHHSYGPGKNVIGASAGDTHTAVWTEIGELFTFGRGDRGQMGHGGDGESVPRLVEVLWQGRR